MHVNNLEDCYFWVDSSYSVGILVTICTKDFWDSNGFLEYDISFEDGLLPDNLVEFQVGVFQYYYDDEVSLIETISYLESLGMEYNPDLEGASDN